MGYEFIDATFVNRSAFHFVKRLQSELDISVEEFCDIMRLSQKEQQKYCDGDLTLDIEQVGAIFNHFDISFDSLLDGSFNFDCLRSQWEKDHFLIAQEHLIGAKSRMLTLSHILEHVELTYGWQTKDRVLRYFQIPRNYRDYLDSPINVMLIQGVLAYLNQNVFRKHDINSIASIYVKKGMPKRLEKVLITFKTPRELYQYFFEEIVPKVDQNNIYRIETLNSKKVVLDSFENEELCEQLKIKHAGGIERCLYRLGTLSPLASYIGSPPPKVFEKKCVHRGDSYCRYEIEFQEVVGHV